MFDKLTGAILLTNKGLYMEITVSLLARVQRGYC